MDYKDRDTPRGGEHKKRPRRDCAAFADGDKDMQRATEPAPRFLGTNGEKAKVEASAKRSTRGEKEMTGP